MIVLYTTERDYPWGTLRSTHASKTKVVLEEKRIPYRIENLPPGNLWKKPPEMLAHHPLGKVPYIEDGAVTIYDSTVIGEYLEDCYSWPALIPRKDPVARAQVRMVEQFVDEAILVGSLPLIWMPYWSEPDKRDQARMEKGRESLRSRDLPYIEPILGNAPEGGYVCGEFSMADVGLMMVAMVLDVDQMSLDSLPNVKSYLQRLRERTSYRAISPRTKVADASSLSSV
ncbi:MAG TPA: glutathione S-transferase family protein [Candidatus Binataceae bacterium]|nr:glutathione S-transferase family protein [Candidatus Binataceae bacterium]